MYIQNNEQCMKNHATLARICAMRIWLWLSYPEISWGHVRTITFLFTQVLMAFAGNLLLPCLLKSLGELGVYICI